MTLEAGCTQADRSRMTLLDPQPPAVGDPAGRTDAELIAAVRAGDRTAYAQLYRRHEPAARRMARQLCASPHDADDLVAEAFARVLDLLQVGRGPDSAFRAYLLTAVRNGLYERARRDRRLELTDDMARHDSGVPWVDPVEAELDSALAARAFASLPERWQTVLWYSEVEQESTAQVGSRLGLRPNAVAALAYRAREGLRQAYLQAHVTSRADEHCHSTVAQLGGRTRDRLSSLDTARVDAHLADCRRCRELADELADVNGGLRGSLGPLLLAASTQLAVPPAATAVGAATAATAVSAGGVAAGAGSAGGSLLGSLAGWATGVYAGAAVLTAVVVGGTAVVAGVGVPHAVHRPPAAAVPTPATRGVAPRVAADEAQLARGRPAPGVTAHPPKKPPKHASDGSKGASKPSKSATKPSPDAALTPSRAPTRPPNPNKGVGNSAAATNTEDKPVGATGDGSKPVAETARSSAKPAAATARSSAKPEAATKTPWKRPAAAERPA
jgi:RNA polymerase sigma factor (sigma-70 family)